MRDRLLAALRDLPIDWPATPEVDVFPLRRPAPLWRGAPALAAAVVLIVLGFVTPVREAVADWLGIGVVRVVEVHEIPADLGHELDLGEYRSPASGTVPSVMKGHLWPVELGPPDALYVHERSSSAVWLASASLPEVGDTGVGALLTRFEGSLPAAEKSIGAGTTLQVVTIDRARAYWLSGEPHSFGYLDDDGDLVIETMRLAGNTLLWEANGSTWRFESGLTLEEVRAALEGFAGTDG